MSRILVVVEQNRGVLHKMSLETLAAAQSLGGGITAAVFGDGASAVAAQLGSYAADRVVVLEHELLAQYTADGAVAALAWLVERIQPELVLWPHTYQVRDYAPRLAARLGRVLASDVTALKRDGEAWVLERHLFQGKLIGQYRPSPGMVFVSIQAGAYRADTLQAGTAAVETLAPPLQPVDVRQRPGEPFRESARTVDLTAAERIVAVGRGIQEEGNLPLVQELAEAMGAELAASRPICDNGWMPMERQVGSSGQTVSPKIYLAIGISGAIQHLVGMKGSRCVVAINKDANAPIFEVSDYGIVGDLFDVVPALTEELKRARG
jgi:electron transfer flavoprotein alpha subunit